MHTTPNGLLWGPDHHAGSRKIFTLKLRICAMGRLQPALSAFGMIMIVVPKTGNECGLVQVEVLLRPLVGGFEVVGKSRANSLSFVRMFVGVRRHPAPAGRDR